MLNGLEIGWDEDVVVIVVKFFDRFEYIIECEVSVLFVWGEVVVGVLVFDDFFD